MTERCPGCGERVGLDDEHECDEHDESPETARVRRIHGDALERRFPRVHREPRFLPSIEPDDE